MKKTQNDHWSMGLTTGQQPHVLPMATLRSVHVTSCRTVHKLSTWIHSKLSTWTRYTLISSHAGEMHAVSMTVTVWLVCQTGVRKWLVMFSAHFLAIARKWPIVRKWQVKSHIFDHFLAIVRKWSIARKWSVTGAETPCQIRQICLTGNCPEHRF